ncbi:hypothetical protein ScPMuIL_000238 [Solemya velum]
MVECLRADQCGYRFLVLFFNCMLTFGSYFCFDMPSVLQQKFTGVSNCTGNETGLESNSSGNFCIKCDDCLAMTEDNYNLLYAIYAWTNAIVVIAAGFLIDKLGNRVSVFLFSFLCVVGSCTFAAGTMLKGTTAMLPVMLLGRLIFGSGNGSLTIVQNCITAYWFRNKELAMAFGITLAFSRLGSVLNFLLTSNFADAHGLTWTLWGGAMLCGLGFVSAIVVSVLDAEGVKQLGDTESRRVQSKKMRIVDIKHFSLQFWLLALAIMFFYNGVFPFVADASQFIQTKYKMDSTTSSYIAGAVYDVSMVISPFLGRIIDKIGKRGVLAFLCAVLTIPVFGLLAFSTVYPLVSTLWLGFTYSVAAASMWPSIPLVVSQATIGTAMGLTTSLQMIGIGLSNLIVGQILGKDQKLDIAETLQRWKYVMIFLLANAILCVTTTMSLNIVDRRRDNVLNASKKGRMERQRLVNPISESINSEGERTTIAESEYSETDPILPKANKDSNVG